MASQHSQELTWVGESHGRVTKFAVQGGIDSGNYVYVIRAYYKGALVPGKLHMSHPTAYIPYGSQEIPVSNYEVLVAPPAAVSWIDCSGSNIPVNAVIGGAENNGERLYIGRVVHNGTITVGKVHPSHGVCYYSYGGEELNTNVYEILVINAYGKLLGINSN